MDDLLRIGAAEVEIIPPPGLPMDGYIARTEVSQGVHDPLMAQVLVLEQNDQRAAVVTLDVLAVTRSFADPLRQAIAEIVGTTADAVWICASHTHAGPAGIQDWFPVGASTQLASELTGRIQARLRTATRQAVAAMQPAELRSAAADLSDVGGDRNNPTQPVDNRVSVLSFFGADGAALAVLFHFACHPTVLSAANHRYSADFPGVARQTIRADHPGAVALYLNGAAGNISTRFFRRDQSYGEVARLGQRLGQHVLALMRASRPGVAHLAAVCETIELPFRAFAAEARALEATGNARLDTVRAEGAAIEDDLRRALHGRRSQPSLVCALRLGAWTLLSVPGEAFSELAQVLRASHPQALVVGYANDYVGYFPTQAAIDAATYEALSSPYDARAHRLLSNRLSAMVQQLQSDRPTRID